MARLLNGVLLGGSGLKSGVAPLKITLMIENPMPVTIMMRTNNIRLFICLKEGRYQYDAYVLW